MKQYGSTLTSCAAPLILLLFFAILRSVMVYISLNDKIPILEAVNKPELGPLFCDSAKFSSSEMWINECNRYIYKKREAK